jgi:hypothetical protein
MTKQSKKNVELFEEISLLRERIKELERSEVDRKRAAEAIYTGENRVYQQRTAIARFAVDDSITFGNVPTAMRRLTEETSAAIQVDRVSVFMLKVVIPFTHPICTLTHSIVRRLE